MAAILSSLGVILFLLLSAFPVQAADSPKVIINEIAWMGNKISYADEWIELYNNTDSQINLAGWKLVSQDGVPEINLTGTIPGYGFYLLERTDDNTVPNVLADQIYSGALGNNGETLYLYDESQNLIDSVNCSSGWFGGDNKTKQTMERINSTASGDNPSNWQTSQNPGGTPKAKNTSVKISQPESGSRSTSTEGSPPTTNLTGNQKVYPSNVFISEILPSPEGPDETDEWIEIFNQNNFEVDLTDWKIQDLSGKIVSYAFPEGTKISPLGFFLLSRPTSKITLNNDADGLKLVQPGGKVADQVNYEKAPRGQSYNKTGSGWVWSPNLTPAAANSVLISQPQEKTAPESPEDKSITGSAIERETAAAIAKQTKSSFAPLSVSLIGAGLAIFSGTIIFVLKRAVKMS
jgi:hypothetical protein